jgi:hypothetical protein
MDPNWEQLLLVGNCSKNFKEFVDNKAYICPTEAEGFKQGYAHTRAKYFAPYVMKGAQAVALIDCVVKVLGPTDGQIMWNNNGGSDDEYIKRALVTVALSDTARVPCLVFLLSELRRTNFEHDSRAGFQQTRQYFDLTEFAPATVEEVALAVSKTPWSALKKVAVK